MALAMLRTVIVALLVGIGGAIPVAAAAGRALLVGVTTYVNSGEFRALEGPGNDVEILRQALIARRFESAAIRVLADAPDAYAEPNLGNIEAGLTWLAETARSGETVVVFLAGHGTQQPNANPAQDPEIDGLDEVFLPKNAGARDELLRYRRGLVDDTIARYLQAIRATGAFLVFISDSCTSESQTRASVNVEQPVPTAARFVNPLSDLTSKQLQQWTALTGAAKAAVPQDAPAGGRLDWADARGPNAYGGMVALYAAQERETTPEERLPRDEGAKVYGLFTFHLVKALSSYDLLSWREALAMVHQDYRRLNITTPTPVGDGELNRVVFGSGSRADLLQWPVYHDGETAMIRAGRMHELAPGTFLELFADPVSYDAHDLLGYARIASADLAASVIEPVAHGDKAALAIIPNNVYARLDQASLSLHLTVAAAAAPATPAPADMLAWRAIEALHAEKLGLDLRFVPLDDAADIRLFVDAGRLWFLPPSGELVRDGPARTPSVAVPTPAAAQPTPLEIELATERAAAQLRKISRVHDLTEVVGLLRAGVLTDTLKIGMFVERKQMSRHNAPIGEIDLSSQPVDLFAGDGVTLTVQNVGKASIDVTVLYTASDYGRVCLYPNEQAGELNRLGPGQSAVMPRMPVDDTTAGPESIVVLATVAEAQERTNLCFLAQAGVTRGPGGSVPLIGALGSVGLRGMSVSAEVLAGAKMVLTNVVHACDFQAASSSVVAASAGATSTSCVP